MLEKHQWNGAAEMLNSQQGTETRFASQILSLSLLPGGNGLQQLQGAEKRVGSSWGVTGEELVGSGWWKMLWEIRGVCQSQCLDPAQNLRAAPGALPSQVLGLSSGGIAAGETQPWHH